MLRVLCILNFAVSLSHSYVSDAELKQFAETLLKNDNNDPTKYLKVFHQGRASYNTIRDAAPNMLFVPENSLFKLLTIAKLEKLYDNYDPDTTKNEVVNDVEKREESEFLNAALNSSVLQDTERFLKSKGLLAKNTNFKQFLGDTWFTIFSRGDRKMSSSAFEHIFLAEKKNGQVSGLHNWLFFLHEEYAKRLNYLGWLKKIELVPKGASIMKVQYSWYNIHKPVGTMFVGTSPEFELALYTVCFLARQSDKCNLSINGKTFHIQTYPFSLRNKKVISSAYPVI